MTNKILIFCLIFLTTFTNADQGIKNQNGDFQRNGRVLLIPGFRDNIDRVKTRWNHLLGSKSPQERKDDYNPGPLFLGGSVDIDLSKINTLVNPLMSILRNSELIKTSKIPSLMAPGVQAPIRPGSAVSGGLYYPPAAGGLYQPRPLNPVRYLPIGASAPSNDITFQESQLEEIKKLLKDIKKSKKTKKPIHDEDDDEPTDEDEDDPAEAQRIDQLLTNGTPGAIFQELLGLGDIKKNFMGSGGKLLTQLTIGTLARGIMKRAMKSVVTRLIPDVRVVN